MDAGSSARPHSFGRSPQVASVFAASPSGDLNKSAKRNFCSLPFRRLKTNNLRGPHGPQNIIQNGWNMSKAGTCQHVRPTSEQKLNSGLHLGLAGLGSVPGRTHATGVYDSAPLQAGVSSETLTLHVWRAKLFP